jgi:hypothetical protein
VGLEVVVVIATSGVLLVLVRFDLAQLVLPLAPTSDRLGRVVAVEQIVRQAGVPAAPDGVVGSVVAGVGHGVCILGVAERAHS